MTFPQELFLSFLCASEHPNQEPAHKAARWGHLCWFVVPIVGFLLFILSVQASAEQQGFAK